MKVSMCKTIRTYEWKNLSKDLLAGLVIMAVSIPISMGYAQIAGLPAVYGLYGSVFPIVLFALFSTSPQFVFGVDAAPAALVGSALVSLGIEGGSREALAAVPVLTFFVAVWLLVFYLCRAGKLVNYISAPVMGGFISGICTTIILMQVPKLFGGKAGVGKLLRHPHQRGHQRRGAAAVGGIFLTRTQQKIGAQAFDLLFGAGTQLTGCTGAGIAVLAALDAPGAPPGGVKLAQCSNGLVPISFFQHLAQPGHAVGILLQYGGVGKVGSFVLGGGAGRSLQ